MPCTGLTPGGTGEELCQLTGGAGEGLGVFLANIDSPLVTFVAFLAIAGAIVAVVAGIANLVKKQARA